MKEMIRKVYSIIYILAYRLPLSVILCELERLVWLFDTEKGHKLPLAVIKDCSHGKGDV